MLGVWLTGLFGISVTESRASPLQACPNVILYLPPGPVFRENNNYSNVNQYGLGAYNHDAFYTQHSLATTSTVVTVHYRLGIFKEPIADGEATEKVTSTDSTAKSTKSGEPDPVIQYKYPLPIHDTLTVLDWVQETFQPSQTSVLGTHIGGSLALTLALTESNSLHAVAALEPVCDWTGLDEYCAISEEEQRKYQNQDEDTELDSDMTLSSGTNSDPEIRGVIPGLYRRTRRARGTPSIAPPDLIPLLEARQSLFYKAQQYFDPFASPMLFVRSPATGVPSKFPQYLTGPEYPVPVLQSKLHPEEMPLDLWNAIDMQDEGEFEGADDGRRGLTDSTASSTLHIPLFRRKILRWPPFGLDYGLSGATWMHPHRRLKRLEMTLPYTHIFVRDANPTTNNNEDPKKPKPKPHKKKKQTPETVLAHQANDMAHALRRACFFGHEKGFAEAGVLVSRIAGEHWPAYAEEEAGRWLDVVRGEQR